MGLDISAYENLQYLEEATEDNYHIGVQVYDSGFDRLDGLVEGMYSTSGRIHDFRAGSYSGYNAWRSNLEEFANQLNDGSFEELTNFSDCEGCIGPKTSAKLFQDFSRHYQAAKQHQCDDHEWFIDKYEDWMKAFRIAANNGAVVFH